MGQSLSWLQSIQRWRVERSGSQFVEVASQRLLVLTGLRGLHLQRAAEGDHGTQLLIARDKQDVDPYFVLESTVEKLVVGVGPYQTAHPW